MLLLSGIYWKVVWCTTTPFPHAVKLRILPSVPIECVFLFVYLDSRGVFRWWLFTIHPAISEFHETTITIGIGQLHHRRQALAVVRDNEQVRKLFSELAPRYK